MLEATKLRRANGATVGLNIVLLCVFKSCNTEFPISSSFVLFQLTRLLESKLTKSSAII